MFAAHHEKALFLHFLRSLLIIYLISVSLEEKTIVLKKKSGKSLEFWIHKFVRTMFINNRLKANVVSFALKHNLFAQIDDNVT